MEGRKVGTKERGERRKEGRNSGRENGKGGEVMSSDPERLSV